MGVLSRCGLLGALVAGGVLAGPRHALADINDLALNRLSYYQTVQGPTMGSYQFMGGCGTLGTDYATCRADNQLFVNLVNQLGAALAPGGLAPANTIGFSGVYFGYENSVTNIDNTGTQWARGLSGGDTERVGTGTSATRTNVPSTLVVSRFHVRKGLPLGFELGMQLNWLHQSSLATLGADIKWSLFEGFRTGVGFLPDLSVRASVSTLLGNSQLFLTVMTADAMISKPFSLLGAVTLTPYVGGGPMIIWGDSGVIDGTPERSAVLECGDRQFVVTRDMAGNVVSTGLGCGSITGMPAGASNDSSNDFVFVPTRILRWRAFGGLRVRYGVVTLGVEFMMDATSAEWLQGLSSVAGTGRPDTNGAATNPTLDDLRQWTVTSGLGLQFN